MDEASVSIRFDKQLKGYIVTSSVNRHLKYFGDTRHRALSAWERDINKYIRWERELRTRGERR